MIQDYVPHCSPAEPVRTTMTPESRCASSSAVSPKSGLGAAPSQVLQPQMASSQVTSAHMGSSQIPQVPPYTAPPSSSATTNAMFRVQMWSNNFDSGVQSLNHSSAPSIMSMSSLRAGSQISAISEDAQSRIELTDQQQLKFENIPPNIGRGSQDGETRNAIPELIHLLSDSDEVVVQRAATMVQNIAKMDSEQPPYTEPLIRASEVIPPLKELLRTRSNSPAIIKPTLGALFQISERRDGLESILRVNDHTNGALLTDIIHHIKFTSGSAIRYAILTFHTIIADRSVDNRNVERARANGALQAVTRFLDTETNEKLLSVLVECVRLLCDKSHSQKTLFLQLNGPAKLFHILRNLRYEGLLWRTTQLLKTFSNADPQSIINCGGYEVLHRQLEHASQRLITSTLECIRNMSDVPTNDLDVSSLLTKLLQLLGAVDPVVVLYCTGILSNLLANNQRNKEFLYSRGAMVALYRVLINSYNIPATTPNQQQRVEDIQERALATLRHLCVGHSQQVDAQKAVLQTEFAAEFLLRKLTEMRPSILKQTLQILNKAALQDCNLNTLRETRLRLACDYEATFAERILLVLKVACEQLPSTQMVEEVRVAELIQLSLSTLQLLCRDAHLLNQVAYLVRRPEYSLYQDCDGGVMLPTFCLYQGYVEDESLKRSALGLISELALHPEMAALYASDSTLMSAFEHYSRSRNQAFATYAEKAYERTVQGGSAGFIYHTTATSTATARPPPEPVTPHAPPYNAAYPQSQQYPPSYASNGTYGNHTVQYPQQTSISGPAPQYHPIAASSQGTVAPSISATHVPQLYGREGPSQECSSGQSSVRYPSEVWPDDLSGLSISDDPFANMFCSQPFDSPQQRSGQQQQPARAAYLAGRRGHETAVGAFYCSPGPPGQAYDQQMQNVNMGSPEAPASWHDPSAAYGSYQL
ncbi:unnamed protein product [Toxocara canis]|uniref:Armadillo/beta-catenin-like repeat protein n=1 Tax=Toxocara canis TaxID=6265 RepID=A0A183UA90_TOXCA|nr:unnamed protein product [Toxocara canis]